MLYYQGGYTRLAQCLQRLKICIEDLLKGIRVNIGELISLFLAVRVWRATCSPFIISYNSEQVRF